MARFLLLSDLHAVAPGELVSGRLDTPALLRGAIDALRARMPAIGPFDAVLVAGDVSDDGSAESYALARAELARLGLPVLAIPGNHDMRAAFRSTFADLPGMPSEGLLDWVRDIAGTRVVGLDTLVEGQGGGDLRRESLDLLSCALRDAGDRPVLIALHHPPLGTGIRFMDGIGLRNPGDLAAILADAPHPARIVAGHVHGIHAGMVGASPVVTLPSLCSAFALDRRADAPVGFMTAPTGCAVIDTGPGGAWTLLPLDHGDGPFPF
ncbi:phosphodiesterase [Jannaschia formosa]|uniref:phosphodiesterase n=1 Tax=Jannaschia formosa TaxID=2259592 RepID=UPI000E1C2E0E|nr:phosphodiesterase [Jannaschia formosa]TFL17215.1 phosphodiesterase [Jannaschia formosa]